ncbi:MAG TPA: hypothetical protein VKE96_32790 [Vicinamibacterales bacterium]|nr:hypothetical protein [Vicinamibacterales bacterium]
MTQRAVDLTALQSNRFQVVVERAGLMRKRYRVFFFAALVAALVVPVGYALSVESMPGISQGHYAAAPAVAADVTTPAATSVTAPIIFRVGEPATSTSPLQVSDAAKLAGIGAILFGLAAVVRKAA